MKIRGIELAGIQIAIEAPSWFDWSWSEAHETSACLIADPDVYLALRLADSTPSSLASTRGSEPKTRVCEVSRSGDESGGEWVIAVHGSEPCERVAHFDASFRYGEMWMSPQSVARGICPIAHPLDEWIVAQRVVRSGGLVIWGSLAVQRGRGLVFLGDQAPQALPAVRVGGGWLVLRPQSEGVRVYALASATGREGRICSAWLHGVHVADSISSNGGVPAVLDSESAAAELVRYSFSPIQDADGADRALEAASDLARQISVIRTGVSGVGHFAWQRGRVGAALDGIGT